MIIMIFFFFFFNDTATTEIYTLSLHDALPILSRSTVRRAAWRRASVTVHPLEPLSADEITRAVKILRAKEDRVDEAMLIARDRKSTRLNSSHLVISYAVFCLKKKNNRYSEQLI